MTGRIIVYVSLFLAAIGSAAGEHWSFQPILRPEVPAQHATSAARNSIDLFIAEKLAEKGLALSEEADRTTLIRRLYFGLVGLPLTPEEISALARAKDPNAADQLVERLLASPQFGERWARHWLDVVRFAETHGFEMNQPRPNAWPYRDYVIQAFNDDLPYDRFILEQIAGDALGKDEATGFLVGGAWDQVKSPDEVLTKNQRADELHDIVNTTGTAFLGLTLGCARCHAHKFDPIPQTDYFAIKAAFEGVQHAERPRMDGQSEARKMAVAQAARRLGEIEQALAAFEPIAQTGERIETNRLRQPVHPKINVERFRPVVAKRIRFKIEATSALEPCLDELEVYSSPGATNIALATAGTVARASGTFANSEIHRLEHIHDARHGNGRSWISDEQGRGFVELEFPAEQEIDRIVWGRDREEKFRDRLATQYRIEVSRADGPWVEVASSRDRRAYEAGRPRAPDYSPEGLDAAQQERLRTLQGDFEAEQARIKLLSSERRVYAGEFREPEPTRRWMRGDPMFPAEVIAPGMLTRIAAEVPCGPLSTNTPERERRMALAHWIASTNNPLTARVIVNRLWQYHFGEGLVSTPSDLGRNGARPTHPELLDWLAMELMHPADATARPWSLKHIHRLIVNSATYRQASRFRTEAASIDAASRWLWRYPPRRLEAEPMRDAILAVAGVLDLRMGGPGWSPFEPNDNYVRVYSPKDRFGSEDFRRMVYAVCVRQRPEGVFGVFDCPDGGQIAPKRTRSTNPLQALNLLNSGFIRQASEAFAHRIRTDAGDFPARQAERAFVLAFGRNPEPDELRGAVEFIRSNGLDLFCRALLNANEFSHLN